MMVFKNLYMIVFGSIRPFKFSQSKATIATTNFRVSETSAQLICNSLSAQVQTDKPEINRLTLTVCIRLCDNLYRLRINSYFLSKSTDSKFTVLPLRIFPTR